MFDCSAEETITATLLLNDFGIPVLIDNDPYLGIFESAGKQISLYDGSVVTTTPTLTVTADVADVVIESNTYVEIYEIDYQVIQKMPDGMGLVALHLTKDF